MQYHLEARPSVASLSYERCFAIENLVFPTLPLAASLQKDEIIRLVCSC
jgi:hypothetical protein